MEQPPAPPPSAGNPSHPPLFRTPHSFISDPLPPSMGPSHVPALDLPLLDLRRLDPALLAKACRDFGLFRLANHGVPPALSAELFSRSRELLAAPLERKTAQFTHPVAYFWGTPAVRLTLKNLNWVEGLHVPLAQLGPEETASGLGPLVYYEAHMARMARALFDAMAAELELNPDQTARYLSESGGTFRAYRYPICPLVWDYFGMEPHTDSSVLSIVNQDHVGGLQVLHDGIWFDVAPVPGTLVVNLGDMMQAISSDEYRSVVHRVLASTRTERVSLCYFAFPEEEGVIVSSVYRPFTYKEFREQVQEDIKATGSKVGLQRFKKVAAQQHPST